MTANFELGQIGQIAVPVSDIDQAVAFYRKLGYQTVARVRRYYLGRMDAWLMAREL